MGDFTDNEENRYQNVDLTLVEFLDMLSSSKLSWNDLNDLFDEYCSRAGISGETDDWIEISPALKAVSAMIKKGVFKA